jgi:hypothetical protein
MSALGQKRTHAAQQKKILFDHLVGASERVKRAKGRSIFNAEIGVLILRFILRLIPRF